jgi:hypothetical protein
MLSCIVDEWSWYGHAPRLWGPAVSRYVNDCPTGTLPPLPVIWGMNAPSLAGL